MKRFVTIMLVLSLFFCIPMTIHAENNEFSYVIKDGGAVITKHISSGNVVIPSQLGGYPVVEIADNAFESPLYGSPLTITSIEFPNTLKKIGYRAFFNLQGVTQINIPDGVVEIGAEAFKSCNDIKTVNIPASVAVMGTEVFAFCDDLQEINVAPGNKNFSSEDGILFNKDKTELIRFPESNKITDYTIPESVKKITAYAFHSDKNLKKVTIPASLGKISDYAFFRCDSLEEVVIGKGITEIGNSAFLRCALKEVNIPEGVTVIGESAFDMNRELKTVTLPSTLQTIEEKAFFDSGVSKINIPSSVTYIGEAAFESTDITEAVIPKGITAIEKYTFAGTRLVRVFIPKSVKSFKRECFPSTLRMIYFEGTEAEYKKISIDKTNDLGVVEDIFKDVVIVYNSTGIASTTDHTHNFDNFTISTSSHLGRDATKTGYCTICGEKSVEYLGSTYLDNKTGISIYAPTGSFDSKLVLVEIEQITETTANCNTVRLALSEVANDFIAYEIKLINRNGSTQDIQPSKPVSVTLNIPDGFGTNVGVFFVDADGTIEPLISEISADGKTITAQVSHFSTYAVCTLKAGIAIPTPSNESLTTPSNENLATPELSAGNDNTNDSQPTADDIILIVGVAVTVVAIGGVTGFVIVKKKKISKGPF